MEPKPWLWPMRWQPGGGALARRGEGTFDSPSQSVPHAESPGLMRSGTWPALYCLYLSASCLSPCGRGGAPRAFERYRLVGLKRLRRGEHPEVPAERATPWAARELISK